MATAVALVSLALCYARVIGSLVDVWSTNALYSYGFAVPMIAAYVWWSRRDPARETSGAPDYRLGVPVTLAGIAMLVVGGLGSMVAVDGVSFVVTLVGVLLLLFGRETVKRHWFALAYLLLMVPVWSTPIAQLQDPSRLLSTKIAISLVHLAGLAALQDGTNIIMATHTIAVLRECSGVNQLIALTAMVLPAAYLWLDSNARRAALLCFAVVISYLGNGIRIAIVAWLADHGFGDGMLTGNGHMMQGLVVSALGYLAIGACFSLLSKPGKGAAAGVSDAAVSPSAAPALFLGPRRMWLDVAVVVIMLGAAAARVSAMPLVVSLPEDLREVQSRIGEWTEEIGQSAATVRLPAIDDALVDVGRYPTESGERRFVGVDAYLLRGYRTVLGARVQLYVGYYEQQRDGKELSGDASEALAAAASPVTIETEAGAVTINQIVVDQAGQRRGLLFWYDVNGRITPDFRRAKAYTLLNAVTRRTTNGAVVLIEWEAPSGPDADAAGQRAVGFAKALIPVLRQHLPS